MRKFIDYISQARAYCQTGDTVDSVCFTGLDIMAWIHGEAPMPPNRAERNRRCRSQRRSVADPSQYSAVVVCCGCLIRYAPIFYPGGCGRLNPKSWSIIALAILLATLRVSGSAHGQEVTVRDNYLVEAEVDDETPYVGQQVYLYRQFYVAYPTDEDTDLQSARILGVLEPNSTVSTGVTRKQSMTAVTPCIRSRQSCIQQWPVTGQSGLRL